MARIDQTMIALALIIAGPQLAACVKQSTSPERIEPAQVEQVDGSDSRHVMLTERAIERIDLQTAIIRETEAIGTEGKLVTRKIVPYSALIYDPHGETWVYINPEPRKFIRHRVEVERVEGDDAVLLSGPDNETAVATVGAAELYGAEFGLGH